MNNRLFNTQLATLLGGDILTLAIVTLFGFASHGILGSVGMRLLTTFLPVTAAWLLVAPHIGALDPDNLGDLRHLWRPFWAMILAAPLAAWIRGAWLNQPIIPVFVVVLGGGSAMALLCWRFLFWLALERKRRSHG